MIRASRRGRARAPRLPFLRLLPRRAMGKRNNRSRFGRRAAAVAVTKRVPETLNAVDDGRGWLTLFDGCNDPQAWQKDLRLSRSDAQRNWTVFACESLIAGDIGKMSPRIMQPTDSPFGELLERVEPVPFMGLLRKPNGYQTWPQMMQSWMLSKLSRGNAYILKGRDDRNVVNQLFPLRPDRCRPLVAVSGDVFYELDADDLAQVPDGERVVVPASEILHDRMNCLYHPLVGLSPLYASALAACQSLTIQEQSQLFFQNGSRPGGVLSSPQIIQDALALQYKQRWEQNFGGANKGRVAVLGNGLKYDAVAQTAVEADLAKQLDMTAQQICSTFHVPGYKVGVGIAPTYQNAEIYDQIYYDSCLQVHITDIEALMNQPDGTPASAGYVFELDLDDLVKMDTAARIKAAVDSITGGLSAPNEERVKFNMPPVPGGDSPYMQQQMFSLKALAERDSQQPFSKPAEPAPAPAGAPAPQAANQDNAGDQQAAKQAAVLRYAARRFQSARSA